MKKNSVRKHLKEIDGGICAPNGFLVNAVQGEQNFALLYSQTRCATACVFPDGAFEISTRTLTEKYLQNGYARAIVISDGVMNAFDADKKIAKQICLDVSNKLKIIEEDVLWVSLGEIGKSFPVHAVGQNVDGLTLGLSSDKTSEVLDVISQKTQRAVQFAYAFELGNYTCKIGGVCACGDSNVCIVTTDVNISPATLQKAISAVTQNTFELFDYGDLSPSDGVYIMASGTAGNYRIDCGDSEYKKFVTALEQTLRNACYQMALMQGQGKVFVSCVRGAQSKRSARAFARALACSRKLRESLRGGSLSIERVLNALYTTGEKFDLSKITVTFWAENGEYVLFEEGKKTHVSEKVKETLLCSECLRVQVQMNEGNYGASGMAGY